MPKLRITIDNISRGEAKRVVSRMVAEGTPVAEIDFGGVHEIVDSSKRPLEVLKDPAEKPATPE